MMWFCNPAGAPKECVEVLPIRLAYRFVAFRIVVLSLQQPCSVDCGLDRLAIRLDRMSFHCHRCKRLVAMFRQTFRLHTHWTFQRLCYPIERLPKSIRVDPLLR